VIFVIFVPRPSARLFDVSVGGPFASTKSCYCASDL
jgi:hypothetical protein